MRELLKRLRYAQPANRIVTSAIRGLFRLLGRPVPEPVVAHLHRVGELDLQAEGIGTITVYSRADDFTPNQAWWRGLETAEPDALLFGRLARDAATVIDVGAYIGVYSLIAARANPRARVIAFEPFPRSRERLLRNIELSGVAANVEVRAAAAGAEAGEAIFHHAVTGGLPSSAGLSPMLLGDEGELAELTVPVETIDGLLDAREIATVDLLKLDTEGTEPEVLTGALGAIERFRPAIVCEILRRTGVAGPVEEILAPLGYRFFHLAAEGPVPMARIEPEPGAAMALNYLMLPESR